MKILNREEMQQADRHTIEHVGIPGYALMECAAQAMLEETEKYIADTFGLEREKAGPGIIKPSVTVLCGSGNNGGDGLVLARRLVGHVCLYEMIYEVIAESYGIRILRPAAVNDFSDVCPYYS